MREIKFRAWHERLKEMFYADDYFSGIGSDNFMINNNEWSLLNEEGEFMCNQDGILLQYTGLKDKNEVEIYEGDILKTTAILASDKIDDNYFNVEVKWNICGWMANGSLGEYQCRISEVIGNIYENEDLLK